MAALRLFPSSRTIPQRCGFGCHAFRAASSTTNGRRLKSSASPAALDRTSESTELPPRRDPLDLSFNDARAAYKSKTTGELLRAFVVLKLSSSNWIINNHQELSTLRYVNVLSVLPTTVNVEWKHRCSVFVLIVLKKCGELGLWAHDSDVDKQCLIQDNARKTDKALN
ncbi:hypothetical protein HPB50_005090 [Hyalomma asiaticum]|uniref:Uncharacterized protein n=1 Tax=Hyalomma asiaticum TaxID=266040 RepID=A0ACB7SF23_HYAAI|nr:hypothetical protein HPB50_005090 [Hyalomma asiaticum]